MSNFEHPPIKLPETTKTSLGSLIAHEACAGLQASGRPETSKFGSDGFMTITVTERCEVTSTNFSQVTALRLTSVPVLAAMDGFLAIELQYGTHQDSVEDGTSDYAEDDEYDWQPYVLIVIDRAKKDGVSVLNARTGEEFNPSDQLRVLRTLQHMHTQYDSYNLEDELEAGQLAPVYSKKLGPFMEFSYTEDESNLTATCYDCSVNSRPCFHGQGLLN